MFNAYIRLPNPQEASQVMQAFQMQCGIPGIVGAIDGTHIQIVKPCVHGETYFNRKGYYSLNIQGIILWNVSKNSYG